MNKPPPLMPDNINPVTKPSGFVMFDRTTDFMNGPSTGLCFSTGLRYGENFGDGWGGAYGTEDGDGYGNATLIRQRAYNKTMP